ncbi:MAG: type II toxin-antitoxin system PemK/MazF family toxin [Anaerolineae bacterium]
MSALGPSRGEVWLVNLNPTRGHEQAGTRPAVIVSTDGFNHGPAGLVVVLPLSTTWRGVPFHVPVTPPEGGLRQPSYVKCEDIRSIAGERLVERWGSLSTSTMALVEDRLRILLEL